MNNRIFKEDLMGVKRHKFDPIKEFRFSGLIFTNKERNNKGKRRK